LEIARGMFFIQGPQKKQKKPFPRGTGVFVQVNVLWYWFGGGWAGYLPDAV